MKTNWKFAMNVFLCERQWSHAKLNKQCVSKLKVATKERNDSRASHRNAKRLQEEQTLSSVQDQKWPLLVIAGSKHSCKGRTVLENVTYPGIQLYVTTTENCSHMMKGYCGTNSMVTPKKIFICFRSITRAATTESMP
ncbi:hypothetical protein DPMN_109056 [Dreissena polymorpha]|uniref:Uncharacterized protein n=1 Tax=Dreissena polymorpha TaxID=45954 RepID=A0A9D4QMK9_DREPO|nr:hypothetical protein DPMN_109056 [Dreissena polymorpha]